MLAMTAANRYHRQMLLPGIGAEGQARLASSHAMIVGCGALGCPVADTLVRAGVGLVTIIDRDVVETTNLHRQTLFTQADADAAVPKADAAAARLLAVNPQVRVQPIVEDLTPWNAEAIVKPHPRPGVIIDCTDNFLTRYLLNDVAVKLGVPLVYGAAVGTAGLAFSIIPALAAAAQGVAPTACLRCVFPEPPELAETCDVAGVYTPQCAIVAGVQASDAIKLLLGRGDLISRTLLSMDVWHNRRQRVDLTSARRDDCPCCGRAEFAYLDGGRDWGGDAGEQGGCRVLCARGDHPGAVHVPAPRAAATGRARGDVDLRAAAERLASHGRFIVSGRSMTGELGVGSSRYGLTLFADGRAIIAGTTDPALARSIYARFIGA